MVVEVGLGGKQKHVGENAVPRHAARPEARLQLGGELRRCGVRRRAEGVHADCPGPRPGLLASAGLGEKILGGGRAVRGEERLQRGLEVPFRSELRLGDCDGGGEGGGHALLDDAMTVGRECGSAGSWDWARAGLGRGGGAHHCTLCSPVGLGPFAKEDFVAARLSEQVDPF